MEKDVVESVEAERDIKLLLTRHMELIAELRMACKDVLEAEHDDIFLLRYVLSFKTREKAEVQVRKAIEYRKVRGSGKTPRSAHALRRPTRGSRQRVQAKSGMWT